MSKSKSKKKNTTAPVATTHDEIMRQIAVLASRVSTVETGLVSVREHVAGTDEELRETREMCAKWRSYVTAKFADWQNKKQSSWFWFYRLFGAGAGR